MARSRKGRQKEGSRAWFVPVGIVVLGVIAYANSFGGVYLFDDLFSVRDNPDFGVAAANANPLSPHYVGAGVGSNTVTSRPVLWATFKLESMFIDRSEPVAEQTHQSLLIEHFTNLVIHLTCGLLIYGIARRNLLRRETWGNRFENSAQWLAGVVAAVWVVHPLNTESVTYIVQRAESLAGMFYLGVIYCLIRSADQKEVSPVWRWGAVVVCFLGVGTKEIAATAPVLALIYDRTFLAGSFAGAWKARRKLYVWLFSSWVLFVVLLVMGGGRGGTVNFAHGGISPLEYARTQLGAIAHYLRLAIVPVGLSFNEYSWPIVKSWGAIPWTGWLLALLVILWLAAWRKNPVLGFLGAWVFLILAPSSSVVPIVTEVVAEHRMYLPLVAVVALVVVGGWMVLGRFKASVAGIPVASLAVIFLVILTVRRNAVYGSAQGMWASVLAKQPDNPQALYNYGYSMAEVDWDSARGSDRQKSAAKEAAEHLKRVAEVMPENGTVYSSDQLLGHMLVESGDPAEAEALYDSILAEKSAYDATADAQNQKRMLDWEAHMMRGQLRGERRDFAGAKEDFEAALVTRPDYPPTHFLLGLSLQQLGDVAGARAEFQRVLQLDDEQDATYKNAQRELAKMGTGGE